MTDSSKKPGRLIAIAFVAFVIGVNLLLIGQYSVNARDFIVGVYLLGIGASFLLAYYFESESMLFRGLIWVCEHFSFPSSRKMAFFYAALSGVLGSIAILQGFGIVAAGHG